MHDDKTNEPRESDDGFTLVEMLVALVILTVGILSMGLLAGNLNTQVTISGITVQRSAALQSAVEEIRATPFESLGEGSVQIGAYALSWTITESSGRYKQVQIISVGPGMATGDSGAGVRLLASVADTFVYRVLARASTQCEDANVVGDDDYDADDDDDFDAVELCDKYYPDEDDDVDDASLTCIIHIPPGNPSNSNEICIGASAISAHLAHGDILPTS